MKFIFYCLLPALFLACNASTSENKNTTPATATAVSHQVHTPSKIEIQVDGLTGGGEAYLVGIFTGNQFAMDTAQIDAAGAMVFQRDKAYTQGFAFVWLPNQTSLQLLLTEDQEFAMHTALDDRIKAMQVTGSLDNELLYRNLRLEEEVQPQARAISQRMKAVEKDSPAYAELKKQNDELATRRKAHLQEIFDQHPNSFFTIFKRAGQNPDLRDIRMADGKPDDRKQVYFYRSEFWDNVDFSDERLLYSPVISNKLDRYMKQLTDQNADSIKASATRLIDKVLDHPEYYKFFSNWIAVNYEPGKVAIMDPEAVYVYMVKNYFTYDRAFWSDSAQVYALQLRADEMARSLIGQPGPMITSTDQDGNTVSMSDIKSKYLVVFLYNPTCDHCKEQTPQLVDLYKKWKPKGLEVFAIAVDTEEDEWKNFIRQQNMRFTNVFDPTNKSIYGTYFVDNTPEVYLLDESRTIFAKNIKVDQIEEVIRLYEEKKKNAGS